MPDVTPDNLKIVFQQVRTYYDEGVGRVKTPLMDNLVETMPMITRERLLAFMDRLPRFRKWKGARQAIGAVIENAKLVADKFELTQQISREHIEDDQIGLYSQRFARMGQASAKWAELLVRDALKAGKTQVGFDGKNTFAPDHPVDVGRKTGTQSNLFTSTSLTRANVIAKWQTMAALKGASASPTSGWPRRRKS
jgi:phage major head subunit gpT-like protein